MPAAVASQWRDRRRQVFQSVFHPDVALSSTTTSSQPTAASSSRFTDPGSHYHHPLLQSQSRQTQLLNPPRQQQQHPEPSLHHHPQSAQPPPLFFPPAIAPSSGHGDDDAHHQQQQQQATYDRAWHVVTAHIALPPSATADDSFGSARAPDSQQPSSSSAFRDKDFLDAFALLAHAGTLLPRAARTRGDILAWHVGQVRAHFAQHVIPLLAGCVDEGVGGRGGDDDDEEENWGSDEAGWGSRRVGRSGMRKGGSYYERHMVTVMSSIRTLEAALRLYFYGLGQLLSGFARLAETAPEVGKDAELLSARFRRDIHALVSNSVSEGLVRSIRAVLVRLTGTILGIPLPEESGQGGHVARPAAPKPDDLKVQAARERLLELVQQLHNVGLAGERFQVLFAEVMDAMISVFVRGAYAGLWVAPDTRSFSAAMDTVSSRGASLAAASPCIASLNDWIENHFARLTFEVLARISPNPQGPLPVSLADLKTYQSLALGRLAALRIQELFDIVLAWPASRPALDDLRATITTAARRKQLTDSFSRALQTRLLHPGCSTLEILQTYISIIRTLHALDPSKVLLSHVEPSLQLYLCHREDAVRVVVAGLLASPEEMRAARKAKEGFKRDKDAEGHTRRRTRNSAPFGSGPSSSRTPRDKARRESTPDVEATPGNHHTTSTKDGQPRRPSKLVDLALLLTDPSQTRRAAPDVDEDLDWNDMNWFPDPVDAGANYKRPKSEDVIGTLISALGSGDVFIKEFVAVVAARLLGEPARFDQELRVLDLLKRRFGEAALQNCDVMIRDVQDSRRVDSAIRRGGGAHARAGEHRRQHRHHRKRVPATPDSRRGSTPPVEGVGEGEEAGGSELEYHARILSRLFWPNLDREHFLLPQPVVDQQERYEQGYESLKSNRKLTWLNQLGQARVELELRDRTVTVDCSTVEATVIYAFQGGGGGEDEKEEARAPPVRKSADELYMQLQMDEDLIAAALRFWVGKGVLRRVGADGSYVVAETLAGDDDATAAVAGTAASATTTTSTTAAQPATNSTAAAVTTTTTADMATNDDDINAAAEEPSSGRGLSARERERREVYWRYIQGMLTNASASMPLGQMAMMMRMLIPEGFPWSSEELQEFLAEKVAGGEMEVGGGKYRLVKK